jgi:hypothetical protein
MRGKPQVQLWIVRHHEVMKTLFTFIICSLVAACLSNGQSVVVTNSLPSDAAIQQKMTGTWFQEYAPVSQSTIMIASNGNYVAYHTTGRIRTNNLEEILEVNRLEGTLEVRGGMMIDTLKKSSITNEPLPLVFTNVIIRVTDRELVYRAQNRSQELILRKVVR